MRIFVIVILLIITAFIVAAGFILGAIRRFLFGAVRPISTIRNEYKEHDTKNKDIVYSDGKVTVLRGDQIIHDKETE